MVLKLEENVNLISGLSFLYKLSNFCFICIKKALYTSSLSMRFKHCTTSINVVFSYEPILLHPKRIVIQKPHALLGCGNVALREGKMVRK